MNHWLPEHHLARFIVEIVEQMDLKPLERASGTSGSAPVPSGIINKARTNHGLRHALTEVP